ncbi:MAG TPA: c-type cytochrome [Fluviicoccus sp.]|nr:c-type cytochrome [Fluviicoccus sp.]
MKTLSVTSTALLAALLWLGLSGSASARSGKAFYEQICSLCHDDGGGLGAPVPGDRRDWMPRLAKGRKQLYRAAIDGMPGEPRLMPGKRDYEGVYSDRQIRVAVDYMIGRL